MTAAATSERHGCDLTLVIPCFNEEFVLDRTVPPLVDALAARVPSFEIVLVNNGSLDGTATVIDRLCASHSSLRAVGLEENTGYGRGVLAGYRVARGRSVGHMPADGPVAPQEVARLARLAVDRGPGHLVSAVRHDRQETAVRKLVSRTYNLAFRLLFGGLSPDINGTPKFLAAADWERLRIQSTDYFLEAEMMLRARALGIRIELVTVASLARPGGQSKVSARLVRSCMEFVRNMVRRRLTVSRAQPVTSGQPQAAVHPGLERPKPLHGGR